MRSLLLSLTALLLALPAAAQLVAPTAIPKGPNPPVVFMDGYQQACPGSFKGTFGNADSVLAASGIASVFFDNCTVSAPSGRPTIEAMAGGFGTFLFGLKYTDGSAVPQVDVVMHSMGGLIVRAFLAGKVSLAIGTGGLSGVFTGPTTGPPALRKGVFLSTPHFGTTLASLLGNDVQTAEMSPGSQFLLDLATWNGGLDDLRGLDAIAIVGNAGTGLQTGVRLFDDGVVTLTSGSLGFVRPFRTRVLPVCHVSDPALTPLCAPTLPSVASIPDAASPVGQIITSFLTGTNAWQGIGTAVEDTASAAETSGLLVGFQDASGASVAASSATAGTISLSAGAAGFFKEALPAHTDLVVSGKVGAGTSRTTVNLASATSTAVISKPGPVIQGVVPAGSAVFPYAVTSGAYVAVYGHDFSDGTVFTGKLPYPQTLGGVTVTVNGLAAALQYVGFDQINMIFPNLAPGTATLTVSNALGKATTQVVIARAVPSIFSLNGFGTEAAAAINAQTGTVVGPSARLKAGTDYVELFLTGLGSTTAKGGLDYADAPVTLTIGGKDCPVTYAGRVPGVPALDQVNCQIPAGVSGSAVQAVINAGGRASNVVTLAIQ